MSAPATLVKKLAEVMAAVEYGSDVVKIFPASLGGPAYLQALQSTRDVRLRALQAAADLQGALAELERAIGEPPPGAPDAAPGPTKP